jgi:hypothetical protein
MCYAQSSRRGIKASSFRETIDPRSELVNAGCSLGCLDWPVLSILEGQCQPWIICDMIIDFHRGDHTGCKQIPSTMSLNTGQMRRGKPYGVESVKSLHKLPFVRLVVVAP